LNQTKASKVKMVKSRFNKKDATTYHLMHRTIRDVGGTLDENGNLLENPSQLVMVPTTETLERRRLHIRQEASEAAADAAAAVGAEEENVHFEPRNEEEALQMAKKLAGMELIDDYDYDKHLVEPTEGGVFIPAKDFQLDEKRYKKVDIIDPTIREIEEVDRQYDSIALTASCIDHDVAQILFEDYEEGEFEELLDDFCVVANQEEPMHDMNGNEDGYGRSVMGEFDFEAHIERLMEKARLEEAGGGKVVPENHKAWLQQQHEFDGLKPLKSKKHGDEMDSIEEDDEDDDEDSLDREFGGGDEATLVDENPGIVPKLNPDAERALCEKFEQTLLEYDSDDVGDLDEECYDIKGQKPLEGDTQIEAAFDQFLQEKKDLNFMMGSKYIRDGGSSQVFVNKKLMSFNKMDNEGENDDDEEEQKIEEVLAEADEVLANPEMDLPPEEVLIDGKSYFTMKEHNPWDCDSILSTYSNLDNNPKLVGRSGKRRNKKKKTKKGFDLSEASIAEERPVQILLSNKTGLPLGVLPGPKGLFEEREQETFVSVNKGEARRKDESTEEKRSRKLLLKQERQVARIQKKMMREAFQVQFDQRARGDVANDVGGKNVFRYS